MIFKEKRYLIIGSVFFINLAVVSLILFLLREKEYLEIGFPISNNFLFGICAFSAVLAGMLWNAKKEQYENNTYTRLFSQSIKYLFLIIIAIIVLNQFFKFEVVSTQITRITIIGSALGMAIFWANKDRIENGLNEETKHEKNAEDNRKRDFDYKFPGINRVPILRTFIKWMYTEGWIYSVILILIFMTGLFLRTYNLDNLEPYADEYPQLIYAKALADTGKKEVFYDDQVQEYNRFNFLTYVIFIFFKIFGQNIIIGRLPGAIFSALTIIAIYFFTRRINKNIGLLSSLFFAVSPWAIAVARNVREYAVIPFFFVLFSIYLCWFDKKISIYLEDRHKLSKRDYIYSSIFFLPLVYAFIDLQSTFKLIALIYFSFALYTLIKVFASQNVNKKFKIGAAITFIVLFILGVLLINYLDVTFIETASEGDTYWLDLFLNNSRTQWFYNTNLYLVYLVLSIGLFFVIYSLQKMKFEKTLVLFSFFITFYFFIFHFDRYHQPRYIYTNLLWFVILFSISVFYFIKLLTLVIARKESIVISIVILLGLLILTMNVSQITLPIKDTKNLRSPITSEIHYQYSKVVKNFQDKIKKNDTIICGLCGPIFWNNEVNADYNHVYKYDYLHSDRFTVMDDIIKSSKTGWIILDYRRGGEWGQGYQKITNRTIIADDKSIIEIKNLQDDEWRVFYWTTKKPKS